MDTSTLKLITLLIFGVSTLFILILSVILNYHWTNYSINTLAVKKIQLVYILITGILFILTSIFFLNTLTP